MMIKALRKLTMAGVAAATLAGATAVSVDTAQAHYYGRYGFHRFGYGHGYGFRRFGYGYGFGYRPFYRHYGFYRPFYRPAFFGPRFYGYGYRPFYRPYGFYGPRRVFF